MEDGLPGHHGPRVPNDVELEIKRGRVPVRNHRLQMEASFVLAKTQMLETVEEMEFVNVTIIFSL